MARTRNTRQHEQTKIVWSIAPEADARKRQQVLGGTVKQAKLLGETIWCVAFNDGTYHAFLYMAQGLKIGLCMYRQCPRKRSECGYHQHSRKGLPGQAHQRV